MGAPLPIVLISFLPEAEKGGQINLLRLVRRLDRERFAPRVLVPATGSLSEALQELGVPAEVLPVEPLRYYHPALFWRGLRSVLRLGPFARRLGPAIYYVDAPDAVRTVHLATRKHGARIVWHAQTSFRTRLDRENLRRADVVVSCSASAAARFTGMTGKAAHRRIPNAVDCNHFTPGERQESRRSVGLSEGAKMVLYAGEFSAHKGLADLLTAFAQVGNAELWVAGRGTDEQTAAMKALAAELGIAPRVRFLGYRRDLLTLLRACDVFAFPSHIEGMSLALLEALSVGCPIVATDIPANTEVITPDTGVAVRVRDADAMARGIQRLLEDPARSASLREAARQRAVDHFDQPHFVTAFEAVFDELRPLV